MDPGWWRWKTEFLHSHTCLYHRQELAAVKKWHFCSFKLSSSTVEKPNSKTLSYTFYHPSLPSTFPFLSTKCNSFPLLSSSNIIWYRSNERDTLQLEVNMLLCGLVIMPTVHIVPETLPSWTSFKSQSGHSLCVRIISLHALRLISWTGKRIW